MRTAVVGLVVCALVFFASGAEAIEPSSFRPGEKEALMKQAAANLAAKKAQEATRKAHEDYLKYSIEKNRREAAYYFSMADMYGRMADQHRANAATIRADREASRPYSIYVTPNGRGSYLVIPNR